MQQTEGSATPDGAPAPAGRALGSASALALQQDHQEFVPTSATASISTEAASADAPLPAAQLDNMFNLLRQLLGRVSGLEAQLSQHSKDMNTSIMAVQTNVLERLAAAEKPVAAKSSVATGNTPGGLEEEQAPPARSESLPQAVTLEDAPKKLAPARACAPSRTPQRRGRKDKDRGSSYIDDLLERTTSLRNSSLVESIRESTRESARDSLRESSHQSSAWDADDTDNESSRRAEPLKAADDSERARKSGRQSSPSTPKRMSSGSSLASASAKLTGILRSSASGSSPRPRALCRESSTKLRMVAEMSQREPRRNSLLCGSTASNERRGSTPALLLPGGVSLSQGTQQKITSFEADPASGPASPTALDHSGADELREGLTREERLRLMVNEDRNVEELVMRIRRAETQAVNGIERENTWEKQYPLSARLVLTPGSALKSWWDVCMLVLVLLSAVTMPLDLAFELGRGVRVTAFFIMLDISFVVDFLLTFRSAYVAEDSQTLVRQPSRILRRWLAGWFAFDLVAALPLATLETIVVSLVSSNSNVELDHYDIMDAVKLIRILRLLKLPRLLDANPVVRRIRSRFSLAYLQLIYGLSLLLYIGHFFACIYIYISKWEMRGLLAEKAMGPGANFTEIAAGPLVEGTQANWLPPPSTFDMEVVAGDAYALLPLRITYLDHELYIFALLWVVTTISGTNVPMPYTYLESAFSMAMVLGGFLVTASVIGTFTTAISQISAASNMEHQKRDYIDQFLLRKKIPKALRQQVAQFFEFAGFDESEDMLSELPISLRLQLDLVLNRDIFLKVPFFKNCDTSFLIVLVPRIHREYAWWGKTVVHEGLYATGLHMLSRGFCRVSKGGRITSLLTTDDFFGEETLLSDRPATATIATVTQCHFMVLDVENFYELLELYPQMKKALSRYAQVQERTSRRLSLEAEVEEKGKQLHRVKLERTRTIHLMPVVARARLKEEIAAFADDINSLRETLRARRSAEHHLSFGTGLKKFMTRRSSMQQGDGSFPRLFNFKARAPATAQPSTVVASASTVSTARPSCSGPAGLLPGDVEDPEANARHDTDHDGEASEDVDDVGSMGGMPRGVNLRTSYRASRLSTAGHI